MNKLAAIAALAVCALLAPVASAQDNAAAVAELAALQKSAKADKRALVAATLNLTPAEAKKFWPIYDNYQEDLAALIRRRNVALEVLVARDKPMSDLYAKNLSSELLAIEEQELKARRKMQNAVMRALPPKKAARYLQLEGKLRAVQAYDIAVAFPLVQ
jgi:Spy/CpxP family protein refolding chaperone